MTRRPTWLSAAAVGGAIALMATSAAPVLAQATPEAPPAGGYSSYPNHAEVDCEARTFNEADYSGNVARIEATDASTVVFTLCRPDGAFLPKVAFAPFAINDADYIIAHAPDGSIVSNPNGTGPMVLEEWRRGQEVILTANPDYWGEPSKNDRTVLRWSSEPGQKLIELQSGTVDGIDNPNPDDLDAILADPDLALLPRSPLNIFYVGMNNAFPPFDNVKVRQAIALGIDKQRIVDSFYPEGSTVAGHFTPCGIVHGCVGPAFPDFDLDAAKALLAEGLAEAGMEFTEEVPISFRVADRAYLPVPRQVAVDLQDQFTDLGIPTRVDEQESGTFLGNGAAGQLSGFHLLGWNADYPDPTNLLDQHFGPGSTPQFGAGFPDLWAVLEIGATSSDPAVRDTAYTEANGLLTQHVPMVPIATGATATAWRADVEGAHSSPLGNEEFFHVGPGSDDQLVFMQNEEPIGLYCADETDGESLRVCEQIMEPLYAFETGGATAIPRLAEECTSNEDATVWTCTIREGVTFQDGAAFDVNDVVTSYAVQWDALNPLHVGNTGVFEYFSSLWGGLLNPPTPAAAE